jgi:hypothetical protein
MSQLDEVADLIAQIQVLKNQLEENTENISKKADENTKKLNESFNKFETKIDTVLNKVKGLTKITNSHYLSVFGGGLFVGAVLNLCSIVLLTDWINKDLIVKRADLKAQIELTERAEAKAKEKEIELNKSIKEYNAAEDTYAKGLKELKLTKKETQQFFSRYGNEISFRCLEQFCVLSLPRNVFLNLNYQYTTKDEYGYEDTKEMCDEKSCNLFLKK